MKKIYSTLALVAVAALANAQSPNRVNVANNPAAPIAIQPSVGTLAQGDTLLYSDGYLWYVNPTDQPTFTLQAEDLDGLSLASGYASAGYSMDWGVFAGTLADGSTFDFHQTYENAADTAFTMYAVSWFASPAQADNWFEFGPITVPAAGATIHWFEKCNPGYRDGYQVHYSTTGMSNYTDFTNTAIYTRTDAYPSPTEATDTVWVHKSITVPAAANGMPTYFAYHHNANDMDVLYIDEVTITEGPASVNNTEVSGFSVAQNYPNPANGSTTINYTLENNSDVLFNVYDVTGKVVYTESLNGQAAGAHRIDLNTANLSNGMYFYTVTVNGQQVTRKFNVSNN